MAAFRRSTLPSARRASASTASARLLGHDLCVRAAVSAALLTRGGRLTVPTPHGERSVWLSGARLGRRHLRIERLGLNAEGRGSALIVELEPEAEAASLAEQRLAAFKADWAG